MTKRNLQVISAGAFLKQCYEKIGLTSVKFICIRHCVRIIVQKLNIWQRDRLAFLAVDIGFAVAIQASA